MRCHKAALVVTFLLGALIGATRSAGQSELIENGAFDSGIAGWAPWPLSDGVIAWSATQGLPPGALKFTGASQTALLQDCFVFTPSTIFFTVDGFMETNGEVINCSLNFFLYTEATDCTGPFGVFTIIDGESIAPRVENPNQWEHLIMEVPIPDDPAETGVLSFRPVMTKSLDPLDDDACIFDNASLRIVPRAVTEVPALSPAGFAVFGVLLSLVALAVLRKTRG